MIKRIPIKGISRDPSGQLSADGMCAESLNVQLDMGEVAPAIRPKSITDASGNVVSVEGEILFIHKGNGYENLIYRDGTSLHYKAVLPEGASDGIVFDGLEYDEAVKDITAIGNTLVVSTSEDMYYILWREGEYHFLGNQIPIPAIGFRMQTQRVREEAQNWIPNPADFPHFFDESGNIKYWYYAPAHASLSIEGMVRFSVSGAGADSPTQAHNYPDKFGKSPTRYKVTHETQKLFVDSIWEAIDKKLLEFSNTGRTIFPVFIRYAVRLYDGTSYAQSIPVLMGADLLKYVKARTGVISKQLGREDHITVDGVLYSYGSYMVTIPTAREHDAVGNGIGAHEYFKFFNTRLSFPEPFSIVADFIGASSVFNGWEDIVSGVDIYISEPITPELRDAVRLKLVDGFYAENPENSNEFIALYDVDIDPYYTEEHQEDLILLHQSTYLAKSYTLDEFKALSGEVILDDINFSADYIMAQEALKETSQSMHHNKGGRLFNYNKRLLLADVKQVLYGGYPFLHSSKWDTPSNPGRIYGFAFYLRGDNGENIVVTKNATDGTVQIKGRQAKIVEGSQTTYEECPVSWIAYPDSRCYRADVFILGRVATVASFRMKQFDQADVSYAFLGFGVGPTFVMSSGMPEEDNLNSAPNTLLASKANNPFVFPEEDSVTFTAGEILNLAVATKPLSEGQFGQFPLYVFTDEGVFALSTKSDGSFQTSHPVSRDILVNKDALTGIEQGIFFASARGLLLLQGSTVTKVSSLMDGRPAEIEDDSLVEQLANRFLDFYPEDQQAFSTFLADCRLAYDYANTRILLMNPAYNTMYVYKFDTQSWHRLRVGNTPVRMLNSYPEAQAVMKSGTRQSVLDFSVVAESSNAEALPGLIYTRDLTFDSADIYKTIHRLKVRGRFQDGHVKWQLQGSNDGINYTTIHSLRGSSWKWYRIILVTLLEPQERISYIEVDYDPKFTDKIR